MKLLVILHMLTKYCNSRAHTYYYLGNYKNTMPEQHLSKNKETKNTKGKKRSEMITIIKIMLIILIKLLDIYTEKQLKKKRERKKISQSCSILTITH